MGEGLGVGGRPILKSNSSESTALNATWTSIVRSFNASVAPLNALWRKVAGVSSEWRMGFASSLSFLNPTSPAFSAASENRSRMSSATSFTASIARPGVSLSSHARIHKNADSASVSARTRSAAAAALTWLDTRFTNACVRLSTSDRAFGADAVPLSTSPSRCPDTSSSTRSLIGRSDVNGR